MRVLIGEDNLVTASGLAACLAAAGHETAHATTHLQAEGLMMSGCFDAVVLDLHMPADGGVQLLRRRRGEPRLSAVPVVLVTASVGPEVEVARAALLPGDVLLLKPFDPDVLLDVLASVVAEKNSS